MGKLSEMTIANKTVSDKYLMISSVNGKSTLCRVGANKNIENVRNGLIVNDCKLDKGKAYFEEYSYPTEQLIGNTVSLEICDMTSRGFRCNESTVECEVTDEDGVTGHLMVETRSLLSAIIASSTDHGKLKDKVNIVSEHNMTLVELSSSYEANKIKKQSAEKDKYTATRELGHVYETKGGCRYLYLGKAYRFVGNKDNKVKGDYCNLYVLEKPAKVDVFVNLGYSITKLEYDNLDDILRAVADKKSIVADTLSENFARLTCTEGIVTATCGKPLQDTGESIDLSGCADTINSCIDNMRYSIDWMIASGRHTFHDCIITSCTSLDSDFEPTDEDIERLRSVMYKSSTLFMGSLKFGGKI